MQGCLEGPREGSPRRWGESRVGRWQGRGSKVPGRESLLCRLILAWGGGYSSSSNPGEMWQL